MPPQDIFEVTSFEIVSGGGGFGRLFEDVILCIHFTLAGGSCPVDVVAHFIHSAKTSLTGADPDINKAGHR